MKKVTIKYNPYLITTEFTIDGKSPKPDSSLNVGNARLQEWADRLPGWLAQEFNDKKFEIHFTGTSTDFSDLLIGFDQSEVKVDAKFQTTRMADVDEAEQAIDGIFADIQKGPIKELKARDIKEAFQRAKNQEFEINVVACMSSGKSTLINALLGCRLMPAGQEATTATVVRIVDTEDQDFFSAKAYDEKGKLLTTIEKATLADMQELNKSEQVSVVEIVGPIPFVEASGMKLVLVDTPGPNNSRNKQHEEMTYRMLADSDKSMVLFVLNGAQLGINDERYFLDYVCDCMKRGGKQSKDRYLFVVNKVNMFDPQPESDGPGCIAKALDGVKKDLENRGIQNPNIFPVAALPALEKRASLKIKSALNTYRDFAEAFDEMHFDDYYEYSHLPATSRHLLEEAKKSCSGDDLTEIYSGIVSLELAIQLYVKKYARTKKVMDLVESFNYRLEELAAEANLRETLRENMAAKTRLEAQIRQIRQKVETARAARNFSTKIDKLDMVSGAQKEVKQLFSGLRNDINKMMAGRSDKVEAALARKQCEELEKQCNAIMTQLKIQIERIVADTYKNTTEEIISEYKKYLTDLNISAGSNALKLNPLKLVGTELNKLNMKNLLTANTKTVDESYTKTEHYTVTTGASRTGNTMFGVVAGGLAGLIGGAFFTVMTGGTGLILGSAAIGAIMAGKEGFKEGNTRSTEQKTRQVKVPKTGTYVNMAVVAREFLQPIQEEMATAEKTVLDYVKSETVSVKSFMSRKLEEIDSILVQKLASLQQAEKDVKGTELKIAESQELLKWLENIEKRVNNIIKF